MEYPSLIVQPIESIEKDSLEFYGRMQFVDNDDIVFEAFKKGENHYNSTNLYILNLKTKNIEQITYNIYKNF